MTELFRAAADAVTDEPVTLAPAEERVARVLFSWDFPDDEPAAWELWQYRAQAQAVIDAVNGGPEHPANTRTDAMYLTGRMGPKGDEVPPGWTLLCSGEPFGGTVYWRFDPEPVTP